jgi:trehalose 6-phosphate synthase/phosphatase
LFQKYSCIPVFLEKKIANDFYNVFSNGILWPLFHYFPEEIEYKEESWVNYKEANKIFLNELLNVYKETSSIWVHDYQLMLLPKYIREKLPNSKIGFFLHIPFLSSEIYRVLPSRKEILEGVLGSDLIGFHTYDYARHFINSCNRVLKCETFSNSIHFLGRTTKISVIPIGIDPKEFQNKLNEKETQDKLNLLENKFKEKIVLLGVDRLDYIKGIPNKLLAFKKFLENNPEYRGRIVLLQVAIPSRTNVSEYQKLKSYVNEVAGEINGAFGILFLI